MYFLSNSKINDNYHWEKSKPNLSVYPKKIVFLSFGEIEEKIYGLF